MKRILAALSALLSAVAIADVTPLAISDQMTLYDANGAIVRQVTVFENGSFDGIGAFGCLMIVRGVSSTCSTDFGEGQPGAGIFKYYYLPDLPGTDVVIGVNGPGELLSDIVGVGIPGTIGFISDGDGPLGALDPAAFINPTVMLDESSGVLDVTAVLDTANMPGFKLTFVSDPEPIPEPAGLAVVGLALAVSGLRRRSTTS